MIIQLRMRNGKVNWKTSNKPTHSEFFFELMENHLSSIGKIALDFNHWRFFKRSTKI